MTGEILLQGARLWADGDVSTRASVLVDGDRIAWFGLDDEAGDHIGTSTEVIDVGGRLLLPGFIDSHNHVRLGSDVHAVQLAGATTLEEIRARIGDWLAEHPDATWVEGEGWQYAAIPGGRMPTASDLEGATGGRPAFLYSYDVHTVWMNEPAMAALGIGRGTERVPFGTVELDPATGEPTGFVTDFAVMGLSREGQAALERVLPGYAPERQYGRLLESLATAARFGITTVVEPQNSLDDLALFERAREEGDLPSRLIAALFHTPGTTAEELDAFEEARRRHDDDRFRVGPVKLYIDDVIEPHTAAMLEPYANLPGERGHLFYEPEEFAEVVAELDRRGFQALTHATGDRGIRTALDAIEHAQRVNGRRDARHQLVHVECLHPDDVPRFAELGVTACMQPRHAAPEIAGTEWAANVGEERWRHAWALRDLAESGAPLAFSSDWNVAEMDPLVGIYSAVTRSSLDGTKTFAPHQAVDVATAIRAYTEGGAWANRCEDTRGSVEPGKYADLIVLSRDLTEVEPAAILETEVVLTMVGGEVVHRTI